MDTEAVIARDPDIIIVAAPRGEGRAGSVTGATSVTSACANTGSWYEDQALSRLGPSVIGATRLCGCWRGSVRVSGAGDFELCAARQCHRRRRSSRCLPVMRTLSPGLACTFSFESFTRREIFLPSLIHACRHHPAGRGQGWWSAHVSSRHQVSAALGQAQLQDLEHLLELEIHLRCIR